VVSNTFRSVGAEEAPLSQTVDTSPTGTSISPGFNRSEVQATLAGRPDTASGAGTSGGFSGGITETKRAQLAELRCYLQSEKDESRGTVRLPTSFFKQLFGDSSA
jgi:hypothetical protein